MTQQYIPEVDPLVPFRKGVGLAGMRTTKGYDEVRAGRLNVVRNGNRTFIRASEIKRYIDALANASKKEAA
ncbi:hypothetical protein [Bosea sp. (in: a-proteobacteria)]|jgi:hypothetical protein|uniref:hypothetical protein n=1 Tax=Bosea sp. (in: a-proteobacteria) TaxID=1871050 RepID=UPI002DDDA4DB|nr:hypothetical protein [Bosea sp. (in: a-proteobacteria)]HEV2508615.1 hypothetical protein [Bosea sp. (in: a-proteobacteria)]